MSHAVVVLSDIIGWAYFLAWSISFYPQVYENWKRKSVEGLSFDFLFYNITGYIGYSIFNLALYFSHTVQVEYKHKYATKDDPDPAIPVEPNDIAFALHALFITIVTIGQCFIYERGNQKKFENSFGDHRRDLGFHFYQSIFNRRFGDELVMVRVLVQLHETTHHVIKIYSPGLHEFFAKEHSGVEHRQRAAGFLWWRPFLFADVFDGF